MAIYKEDIVDIELESGTIHRSWLMRAIGLGDAKGNRFGVRLLRNGEPVNVGSATVTGLFMAPNGTNYVINESQVSGSTWIDGNVAGVILPSGCYAVEGQFCMAIKLSQSGVVTTMRIIDGMVSNTGTTGAVVPSSNIPTGDQIIAAYQQAMAVIDNSVRYDVSQELTNAQKRQARLNVNAAGMALLAPVYSSSSTYAVGDHVHYDGYYYVCNTAITTAEEWTAAHWTQVTVGGEVSDLKSAIDQLQIKLTVSVNNANYNIVFPVLNGHTYKITNNASANASAYTTDQSNTQIQDIGIIGKNGGTATFTASANAYKIRGYCSGSGSITVEDLGTDVSIMQQTLADVVPRLSAVETIAENSKNQLNIDTSSLNSGYIGTDGAVNSPTSNNEKYTNRIGCIPGQKFTVSITLPSPNGMWLTYAEYDKKGKFITRDGGTHGWVATYTETFTVPIGVYAIIVSYRAFTGGTIAISCDSWSYFMTNINLPSLTLQRDFHLQNSAYDVSVRGINHTGYYTAPENTLPAFKLSKANGFAFVETDLQLSSDNVPVLIHDTSINRTGRNSDGTEISSTLYVHDLTYQQLQQYDFGIWKSSEYAGTKIPSLEQFIVLCKNLNLHAYIELKGGFWTTATFTIAYGIVEKYQMETRVTWISTSENYLKLVKAKDEYARIAYVVSDIDAAIITACTNLLTEHNSVVIDVLYTAITTEKIAIAVAAGLPIEAYTIDSESDLRSLDGYISGVTSDIYNYSAWLVEENTN